MRSVFMSADTFQENFRKLVEPIKPEDEIILLADILSGSPFTKALEVLSEKGYLKNTIVIAGMNMKTDHLSRPEVSTDDLSLYPCVT